MKTAIASLIFCVGSLLTLGLVMLYSSSMAQEGAHYLTQQFIWGALGILICVSASFCDYRWLKAISWVLFGIVVVMLGLVLIPHIGVYRNGSRRWFNLGICLFQPSEAAKIGTIVIVAWYGDRFQRNMREFWRGLVVPGLILLAVLGLIFKEPDRGTTILLGAVGGSLMLLAGARWIYLALPVVSGITFLAYSLMSDSMRMNRIMSWLNPEESKSGVGYQAYQAMIALGAGGTTGLGLGNGRQKLGFVPEHHTDFILSVIGEEMGLVATIAIVVLFIGLILCGMYIACKATDTFGFLIASGITLLIGLQAMINIGVVTSALPNKGLPLPFISYGGSSLALMLMCIGILVSVGRISYRETAQEGLAINEPELAPA